MTTLATAPILAEQRTKAPIGRLLRAELRFMIRRPRTLVALVLLALTPIVAGIGISVASSSAAGNPEQSIEGLAAIVDGNGMILPVFVLLLALAMLPLMGAMWSADAIAGESASGGLRGLLLAPVSRARLLAVKAFGVAVLSLLAVIVIAVVGILAGVTILGGGDMLTMSGNVLPFGSALGRIALLVVLVTVQVWAVAAVALAISASTDHPLVVLATTLGGIIMFTVLGRIESLDWLHPVLLTQGWEGLGDVVRDPMPTDGMTESVLRAACYIVIGYSLALARMITRDG